MLKEFETTKLLTSVEQNGKVVGLYFEHELPSLPYLYRTYGKENVHTQEIKLKTVFDVLSDREFRRRVNNHLSVSK